MKKRCPRIKRLHAFVSGDADEPEQNRIEQHLHTCFLCRELVETIESEKDPFHPNTNQAQDAPSFIKTTLQLTGYRAAQRII